MNVNLKRIDNDSSPNAVPVYAGSDNIFADLGLPEPELLLAKAELVYAILSAIEERDLTQSEASALMGITPIEISALVHGRLDGFTLDRLLHCLTALGKEVHLLVQE